MSLQLIFPFIYFFLIFCFIFYFYYFFFSSFVLCRFWIRPHHSHSVQLAIGLNAIICEDNMDIHPHYSAYLSLTVNMHRMVNACARRSAKITTSVVDMYTSVRFREKMSAKIKAHIGSGSISHFPGKKVTEIRLLLILYRQHRILIHITPIHCRGQRYSFIFYFYFLLLLFLFLLLSRALVSNQQFHSVFLFKFYPENQRSQF